MFCLVYFCLVCGQVKQNHFTIKENDQDFKFCCIQRSCCLLFCKYKILKFILFFSLDHCIFLNKCFNDDAFSLSSNYSKLTATSRSYCTRSVSNGLTFKRFYQTIRYNNKSLMECIGTYKDFLLNMYLRMRELLIDFHITTIHFFEKL